MTKNLADELQRTARQALTGLYPSPQGEEPGGLSFQRLLSAAFRARYLVFATTIFGILIGTFLAITTANSYVSKGTFQITGAGAESMLADPTRSGTTSQESIATGATYILDTDEPLKRVITRLGPARILAPYQPRGPEDTGFRAIFFRIQRDWNATREEDRTAEEALKYLQKAVTVERPRFTDVILVNALANDAHLAQEICATFMEEAKKLHIEKYEDTRAYDKAHQDYEDARARHKTASGALREFLERKAQVEDFDMEKRRLQLGVIEGQTALEEAETEAATNRRIIEEYTKQLEGPNAVQPTILQRVAPQLNAETIARREGELAEAHEKLFLLKRRFTNHSDREITTLEGEIEAKRATIEKLREDARKAEPVEQQVVNPLWVATNTKISEHRAEMAALDAKLELLHKLQGGRHTELKAILALENEFAELRKARLDAEERENATRLTWEAVERKRALGEGNFSTLKDIEPASLPLEKEGPNRSKLLLAGMFVGLFLGLGIIVLRTLPDTVVRTREDLEAIEGLAVIGVMPRLDSGNLRRHVALRERGW